MIQIDRRKGSAELQRYFTQALVTTELTTLQYGDFAFEGSTGPGKWGKVGIERKTVRDMLGSMRERRFQGHQLPGMLETYDHSFLIVEGSYRAGRDGYLQIKWGYKWDDCRLGASRFMYSELQKFLIGIAVQTPMKVFVTEDERQTVWTVRMLESYFQKPWEKHASHTGTYAPVAPATPLRRSTPVEIVASLAPGIGSTRAIPVGKKFSTIEEMVFADPADWEEIEGVGKTIAKRVWGWFRGLG